MSATTSAPATAEPDQRIELGGITWDQYVTISDTLAERPNPRLIYLDGRLTILVTSRRHDLFADNLSDLVKAVAGVCGIPWTVAGHATFRREGDRAGVEGDQTFYFGDHAELMQAHDIDLNSQPPPDLAIEVEVTHPANQAMATWERVGVPEVWRYDANTPRITFWVRGDDGTYAPSSRSAALPVLTPADVLEQLRLAATLRTDLWYEQLRDWARVTLLPRLGGPR